MKRLLSPAIREYILEKYNYHCVYCGAYANTVDHIIPYAYIQEHNPDNLVACCNDCNVIAQDKIFENFEQKATYIKEARSRKKWKRRLRLRQAICADCKAPFRPGVHGATNLLCPACAQLADLPDDIRQKRLQIRLFRRNKHP